jgi:hypothetical protein
MSKDIPFTELFPVRVGKLPTLYAYHPTDGDALPRQAARRSRQHGGRWAAVDQMLLTDTLVAGEDGLKPVQPYTPSPTTHADYVIGALVPPLSDNIYQALQTPLNGNFRVLQRPILRAWVVDEAPALSIGLAQTLVHKLSLADYAATIPDVRGLVRMLVITRSPLLDYRLLQGVIGDVSGTVADHRDRLTRFAATKAARKRIKNAPDTEPVVNVVTPFGAYQFAASELYIVLRPQDYRRLRVDEAAAKQASYQHIAERARGVAAVSGVLKAMDYIGDAFRADKNPKKFLKAVDTGFSPQVMLGDGKPRPYAPHKLWRQLQQAGMFGLRESTPLTVGILSALGTPPPDDYHTQAIDALKALGVPVAGIQTATVPGLSADETAEAFRQLGAVDALLAFMPGRTPTANSPKDDWGAFITLKRVALAGRVFSLCLWEPDLRHPPHEAALAFAGVLGHAPFALGEPLPTTDLIIGLTLTPGAVLAQVYEANGVFVGYILHRGPLDAAAAVRLLPEAFFRGTRVILQTLSDLPGIAQDALNAQAARLDVTLHLSTVNAGANPNLYSFTDKVRQPATGTAFLLGPVGALLVPAMPPHPDAPVNPLHITSGPGLPIPAALGTVLAMNALHPTSRKPRLPVHLADHTAIQRLLEADVLPPADEGAHRWWA